MSYDQIAGKFTPVDGAVIDPTEINTFYNGLQTEFESRWGLWLNGVLSGFTCTINGTSIDVAAGVAYCEGKRYTGGDSVSFVGQAADTYWVYLDPTDNTVKAKTTEPLSTELTLCKVDWNGTDTLSNLDTAVCEYGVVPHDYHFFVAGAISTGIIGYLVLPRDFWIESVTIVLGTTGTAGDTIVDVHAGAAGGAINSIFTTQANRPTLNYSAADNSTDTNDNYPEANRKLSAGDILYVEVDSAATGASDLGVTIKGRWC